MNNSLRPEYVNAIEAALWNHWFAFAYLVPFLILIPASRWRWLAIAISPLAFFAFFTFYFCGVRTYDHAFVTNAVTEFERELISADTARVFMPIVSGIPFGLLTTCVAAVLGQLAHPLLRRIPIPRLQSNNERFAEA